MELDKDTLDKLIQLMQREGLDRLRVRVQGMDVDLRMTGPPNTTPAHVAGRASRGPTVAEPAKPQAPPNVRTVLAPLVGVFYRAPAPGSRPFVEVGDQVTVGQTLCILEAMKLMNEIVSEHNGRIAKILPSDAELVALHQELFWIET